MGYKRYGSSISIPQFEEEEGEAVSSELSQRSPSKTIYFGIKKPKTDSDSNRSWRELTSADFNIQITSDTTGCSATIKKNTTDTTNKTGIITYTLSKNSTGSQRLITFKYKDTELFKILQDPAEEDNNIYVYLRYWVFFKTPYSNIITSTNNDTTLYRFSLGIDSEDPDAYISYETWKDTGNIIYHVTNNKDLTSIFNATTSIKKLVDNGTLTYIGGKNFDNNTISSIIKFPIKMYKNENTLVPVNDNSTVYIYYGGFEATVNANDYVYSNDSLHSIINWGNVIDGDVTSIGKYKYNSETTITYTVTWNLNSGTINGNTSNPKQVGITSGSTVSFVNYIPQRTGYTFEGWAETSTATSGKKTGNSEPITSNKTFYAIWKVTTKNVIFSIGSSTNYITITWSEPGLPDTSFTIQVKDVTISSTYVVTIPGNIQNNSYKTNIASISGHSYGLVSCSPTTYNNVNYSVFTGLTLINGQ